MKKEMLLTSYHLSKNLKFPCDLDLYLFHYQASYQVLTDISVFNAGYKAVYYLNIMHTSSPIHIRVLIKAIACIIGPISSQTPNSYRCLHIRHSPMYTRRKLTRGV